MGDRLKAGHQTQGGAVTRDLKLTLTLEEFGVVNWAQRNEITKTQSPKPKGLAPFARRALFEAVQQVITDVANRGGSIPPGVAKDYENWKNEML